MAMLPHASAHSAGTPRDRWQRAMALPIFGAALALYGLTLAPTVVTLFDDSLEFQLVTYQLGIAHPPGYPLYTLLGWLFTRLPVGDVAYRVNLMSAVFGALTVALVYLIGLELTPGRGQIAGPRRSWASVAGALIGALALAISPVFWSQATVAEVYTLNAAFVAGILWLLVRGRWPEQNRAHSPHEKRWLALAFLVGLSLTHHRTMVLLLPAIAFYLWRRSGYSCSKRVCDPRHSDQNRRVTDPTGARNWGLGSWEPGNWGLGIEGRRPAAPLRTGMKLTLAVAMPLLLYLYLPLRGHVGSLDGTYTNTLAGFWQHVTAAGYGVFIFDDPFGAARGPAFYLSLFLEQFGLVGLAAGLVGFVALRRPGARTLTGIAFVTYVAFNLFYRVADIQVFFIPPFLIWAMWVGIGAAWLLTRLGPGRARRLPWLRGILSLMIILLFVGQSAILLWNDLPALDRSDDWAVYDYGLDLMRQPLESNAAVVGILGEITLVRYFQATEGLRPDLLPIAADREAERLATVTRLLDEGRAVYLTRELPGAPARWSLSAVGPLIRVNPQPTLKAPDTPFLVGTPLTAEIALHGYTIGRPSKHVGPPPLRLTLAWQVTAPITRELKVSARLYPADTSSTEDQPTAQADAVPVHFAYPTTAWRPGEFITDVYDLPLPPDLQPGEYTPLIILYDPAQGAAEVGRLTLAPVHLP